MKILHISEILQGGVGACMDEIIAPQVASHGVDNVRVLIPESQAAFLPSLPRTCVATYRRSGRNPRSMIALGRATLAVAQALQPTIVHIHSTFAGAVCRPLLAAMRPRPQLIYCAHGWSFLMVANPASLRLYTVVERLLSPMTDLVIALSNYEYEQARQRRLQPKQWTILMNGIEDRPVPPRRGQDDGRLRLLFVGVFRPQKGLDLLLKVMERLQGEPIHLDVVGAGLDMSYAIDVPGNVSLHGWQSRDDLDRFFGAADAVVAPSRWEACSMVALEAMRAGVAVVASRRGTLPELVDDGRTGLLFDLDEDDLSGFERTLRSLDRTVLRSWGEAGRRRYDALFTADRMNASLVRLYDDLLAGVAVPFLAADAALEQPS